MDKATIIQMITDAYNAAGLNPAVGIAQAKAESGFNPLASSGKAQGLFQFTPDAWSDWGNGNIWDVSAQIAANVAYMKFLISKFNGRLDIALAAYNSGPNRQEYRDAAAQNRPINWAALPPGVKAESRPYAQKILSDAGIPAAFRMPAPIKR